VTFRSRHWIWNKGKLRTCRGGGVTNGATTLGVQGRGNPKSEVTFYYSKMLLTWCFLVLSAGLRSRSRSRKESWFLGGGGVGFLTTLGVGVGFFLSDCDSGCPIGSFLHHTPKLRIPVEMVQFLLKLLLKQRFLAVYHDFHWFWQLNFIPFMSKRRSRKFWKGRRGAGVGNFGKSESGVGGGNGRSELESENSPPTPQPWL